ncbi:phage tail assembly chaperone [Terrihabitans sp. B22-R8]|uniref:phage tail assembly chaperone n=1 Tax=Terrihabitans sp. B22-R8 TaxID=3425128 RepID=UPI00403C8866
MTNALRWELAWGEHVAFLEELAAEGPTPQALREQPELPEHLFSLWDAFHELSTDRQIGMAGAGPIMFSSIDRYACRFGIEGDDFDLLASAIRAMDAEWREHMARQGKTKP